MGSCMQKGPRYIGSKKHTILCFEIIKQENSVFLKKTKITYGHQYGGATTR